MKFGTGAILILLGVTGAMNGSFGAAWLAVGGGVLMNHSMAHGDKTHIFGWHIGFWTVGALIAMVAVMALLNPTCCGPGAYDGSGTQEYPVGY